MNNFYGNYSRSYVKQIAKDQQTVSAQFNQSIRCSKL